MARRVRLTTVERILELKRSNWAFWLHLSGGKELEVRGGDWVCILQAERPEDRFRALLIRLTRSHAVEAFSPPPRNLLACAWPRTWFFERLQKASQGRRNAAQKQRNIGNAFVERRSHLRINWIMSSMLMSLDRLLCQVLRSFQ